MATSSKAGATELNAELLIKMAEDFYERACSEFAEAVAKRDPLGIRDSAEKAWNAVVQAVDALILSFMERIPSSHFERRRMLREIEQKDERVEKLGVLDRYMARYKVLHGETFYEGLIDVEQLETEMEKTRKLIEDIKALLAERKKTITADLNR
ncbi:MAG: PaREP1 family protein [Thermofilaceae archaeon]